LDADPKPSRSTIPRRFTLENAGKAMNAKQLLELKTEKSDLVVSIAPRADTVANVGFALGRVTSKLMKAAREKMNKT
jgi:hypothetical protein